MISRDIDPKMENQMESHKRKCEMASGFVSDYFGFSQGTRIIEHQMAKKENEMERGCQWVIGLRLRRHFTIRVCNGNVLRVWHMAR